MPFTVVETLLRLGLALVVGMAIGLEREWREKAAGFRTITLVTVGSAMFVLAAGSGFVGTDRARIAAGVVTGIGFLGAGTILRERGEVIGLTTAATVWAACALGIGAAFGAYAVVVAGAVVVLLVLVAFNRVDVSDVASDVRRYEVTAPYSEERYAALTERFEDAGLSARRKSMARDGGDMVVVWEAFGGPDEHIAATRAFMDDPGISRFQVV
jgi:putative Mg2+ transporter-C (MgtC) family protein